MHAKLNLCLLATFLGFAASAFAQIDGADFAADLRAKYGPPLARETFTGRAGIEMVVDFAVNGHVCTIQLPSIGPSREPGVKTGKAVDDFLLELVPLAMRGKELGRFVTSAGALSVSVVEYENVTIAEAWQGQRRTGVTVIFTKEKCRDQSDR